MTLSEKQSETMDDGRKAAHNRFEGHCSSYNLAPQPFLPAAALAYAREPRFHAYGRLWIYRGDCHDPFNKCLQSCPSECGGTVRVHWPSLVAALGVRVLCRSTALDDGAWSIANRCLRYHRLALSSEVDSHLEREQG
jgi:hypothetical protein